VYLSVSVYGYQLHSSGGVWAALLINFHCSLFTVTEVQVHTLSTDKLHYNEMVLRFLPLHVH